MTTAKRGDRVRLIHCTDTYTKIQSGAEGTVALIDSLGTVHVRWDNGISLGLIPGADRFEVIPSPVVRFTITFDLPVDEVRTGWAIDGEPLGEAAHGVCLSARATLHELIGDDGMAYLPRNVLVAHSDTP